MQLAPPAACSSLFSGPGVGGECFGDTPAAAAAPRLLHATSTSFASCSLPSDTGAAAAAGPCAGPREPTFPLQEASQPYLEGASPLNSAATFTSEGCNALSASCLINSGGNALGDAMLDLPVPPHGVKACMGGRARMEDTFSVHTGFFELHASAAAPDDIPHLLPARLQSQIGDQLELPLSCSQGTGPRSHALLDSELDAGGCSNRLHFFGVYDGHGGSEAAQHCANRLHRHLMEALASLGAAAGAAAGAAPSLASPPTLACTTQPDGSVQCRWGEREEAPAPEAAIAAAAAAVNEHLPQPMCSDDHASVGSDGSDESRGSSEASPVPSTVSGSSITHALEDALKEAFRRTDAEFAEDHSAAMVGTTAVVAVVGSKKAWVANCGDSRAVLCRGSKAIQLTDDHKPEREDEAERVERAGGQVLYWNGHRVMGVLAMSRAIGDHSLRPYIIAEPEVTMFTRTEDDQFLLLASDGLWDVMSNQEAISLAMRCSTRAWEKGASRRAAVRIAASVLTKAAIDRGSKDNVTVVIIDLKNTTTGDTTVNGGVDLAKTV